MNNIEQQLAACRSRIDDIDAQIAVLFAERLSVCDDIAEVKKAASLQVIDVGREEAVVAAVREKAGASYADDTETLYRRMFEITRGRQHKKGA